MLSFQDILNHMDELLYEIVDLNGTIIYPEENQKTKKLEKIINNKDQNSISYDQESNKWYQCYIKNITKNNNTYLLKYLVDITDIKEDEKKYHIDGLTSVFTRANILKSMQQELNDCKNNNIPFAIVMSDIDHFKKVNDTYGHLGGDKVLKEVGSIFLKNTQDENEFIGRYGGEEFIFFFKNVTVKDVISKISAIKKEIEKISIAYNEDLISNISMSFGIYHSSNPINDDKKITDLLSEYIYKADTALYISKNQGRNQAHIYNEDDTVELVIYK